MEEIQEVNAGDLITAQKFKEIISNINKNIKDINDIYLEIDKMKKNILILENKIGMKFTLIDKGEFTMGSVESTFDGSEKPAHTVTISKPFYLGTYPVTQHEWKAVMGMDPSSFEGNDLPVENVSWDDVQEFIAKLNNMEGTNKYRLPSEAEWEYSARAGTTTKYSFGNDDSELGKYAWFKDNSDNRTHPVGKKMSNPWGLYDMHGNVWEWVQDEWHVSYEGAPTNGSAWEGGSNDSRVIRGFSWANLSRECRSAIRGNRYPSYIAYYLGFRLLKEL